MARKGINKKVEQFVHKYLQVLQKDKIAVKQLFVFGSHVKGKARKDSDIDVAVVSPNLHNSVESTKYLLQKAHELDMSQYFIEPHGFTVKEFANKADPLAYEIKKTGVRIL